MIIELLCTPLKLLVGGLINLLPVFQTVSSTVSGLFDMLHVALQFFPSDVWLLSLSSIIFWLSVRCLMAIVFFILDIIVGVIP